MPKIITNREASRYVTDRVEFKNRPGSITEARPASTLYARWHGGSTPSDRYVVYSYGTHWPLYIYDALSTSWFANSGKYSRTTSRHYQQARPAYDAVPMGRLNPLPPDDMRELACRGLVNWLMSKAAGKTGINDVWRVS
jgi:hypothetical protein